MELNRDKTAVLGLHWQSDVISEKGPFGTLFAVEAEKNDVVRNTRELFTAARAGGLPIIYTRIAFAPGYGDMVANSPLYHMVREAGAMVAGTPGTEIIDELAPQTGELVLTTTRVSGFANSSLDLLLRSRGIDTLLLTGVATNITVEGTARHASDLGYRVIVLSDCTSSDSPETHVAALNTLGVLTEVATSADVIGALSG